MIPKETLSEAASNINNWLPNYIGLPYKHLGITRDGIDCFNLCHLVYKEQLDVIIPYTTQDTTCSLDVDWYNQLETQTILIDRASAKWGWKIVEKPEIFDIVVMSIGATNTPNHCGMYLGYNKLLQTMEGHSSWVSTYGTPLKQYTVRIVRWNGSNIT